MTKFYGEAMSFTVLDIWILVNYNLNSNLVKDDNSHNGN